MNPRWLFVLVSGLFLTSAGLAATTLTSQRQPIPTSLFAQKEALPPDQLAQKSGCFECHDVEKNLIGPPYKQVAARYKGKTAARSALIATVKNGGKGNWSEITKGVPMPPHGGRLSSADITRLVDWVLSLEDK